MKIDRIQLADALLQVTLDQFQGIPEEGEIHHEFSRRFQENISRIQRKSEGILLGAWSVPVRKLVFIAVLVAVMLATLACAMPAIRKAILKFFIVEKETYYGITFDPDEAVNTPSCIEKPYIPSFEPEGYTLTIQEYNSATSVLMWVNEDGGYIHYHQAVVQENAGRTLWTGIDAEGADRITREIDGYLVEIVRDPENLQYVAVWTDDQYIYTLDISDASSDPEQILRGMINSMVKLQE